MAHVYNINLPLAGSVDGGVDTSKDTVTAEVLEKGYTAHDKDGNPITGTLDTEAIRAEGVEAGKKSEHDAFWDNMYNKTFVASNISGMFAGKFWDEKTFRPPFDLDFRGMSAWETFKYNGYRGDMVALAEELGIRLNFKFNYVSASFDQAEFTRLPTIDFSGMVNDGGLVFQRNEYLETIDKIIINENCYFNYWFSKNYALKNLTFEGTISNGGLNVSWSPLSKASILSVINHLSDTTTGLTVTLRLSAIKKAFETSEGANNGAESSEWLNLVSTKPNWTINAIDS